MLVLIRAVPIWLTPAPVRTVLALSKPPRIVSAAFKKPVGVNAVRLTSSTTTTGWLARIYMCRGGASMGAIAMALAPEHRDPRS